MDFSNLALEKAGQTVVPWCHPYKAPMAQAFVLTRIQLIILLYMDFCLPLSQVILLLLK